MKPCCSKNQNHGLTLLEVLVVIFIFAFFALMFFPRNQSARPKSQRIACVNNLKEVALATRIWEGDHGDLYPMAVSQTNGGAMEPVTIGDATAVFQVMSNELSTPH